MEEAALPVELFTVTDGLALGSLLGEENRDFWVTALGTGENALSDAKFWEAGRDFAASA